MAHERARFLIEKLKKSIKQSPSISLLGMRQSGKTTLIKQLCNSYLTLDDDRTLNLFRDGNWAKLDSKAIPIAIDECQKLPELFDHVKLLIDQKKQMGRFILTGSVRFLSKKQIKESLTGRTLILELLPMTIAESHEKPQYDIFTELTKHSTFESFIKHKTKNWCTHKMISHHLLTGGLPGICYKRDTSLRQDLLEQHVDTLLSRDLPMLYQTKLSHLKLKLFLKELTLIQGIDWSIELVAKKIGVSAPTLRALLQAFEGLFLLRVVGKRIYLEDSGVSNLMVNHSILSPIQVYRSFVFRELFALIRYRYSRNVEIKNYFTRGGVDVPFLIELNKYCFAFTVDEENFVTEKSIKSLGKLKLKYKNAKRVAFHQGENAYESTSGVWCLPLTWLV